MANKINKVITKNVLNPVTCPIKIPINKETILIANNINPIKSKFKVISFRFDLGKTKYPKIIAKAPTGIFIKNI